MPFVIEARDAPGKAETRKRLRPAHIAYLEAEVALIIAAGALLDDEGTAPIGSLYIIDTDDRRRAEAFIQADPYFKGGVFSGPTVTRWRKGFFDHQSLQQAARCGTLDQRHRSRRSDR